MKYLIFFLIIGYSVSAQNNSDPALQSLIDAERAFSLLAKEKNTRDAFVYNLTEKSIGFYPGPGSALTFWEAQTAGQEWLFWQPSFAYLAASGDYGYTYGPWSFSKSRTEKPEAFGDFITVWEKQDGKWKVAVDIGIAHGEKPVANVPVQTSTIKPVASTTKDDLLDIEKRFLSGQSSSAEKAYFDYASTDIRFFRQNNFPIRAIQDALGVHSKLTYTPSGSSIASTGDLGFVYGTVSFTETKDGQQKTRTANYLRIWKKEEGKAWKIVVDVVS
ncbi:MAG TPA: nuclear transport factor 2 family protein [Ohtaekwangia sp.]